MTLLDLCNLIKRNAATVVAIPIICAVVCALVLAIMPKTYVATSSLTSGADIASVTAGVKSAATAAGAKYDATLEVTATSSSKSFSFAATAHDANTAVSAATAAATAAFKNAYNTYVAAGTTSPALKITNATSAKDESPSIPKYALIALLVGLFAAICIVVIKDIAKSPVHNAREAQDLLCVRHLGFSGADPTDFQKESLLTNARFACANPYILSMSPLKNNGEGEGGCGDGTFANAAFTDNSACADEDAIPPQNTAIVVGVGDGDLSVQTCCNLAAAADAAGAVTLVVDANLREPDTLNDKLAAALGATGPAQAGGIADIITGAGTVSNSTVQLSDNVFLLPSGGNYSSAVSVLESREFAQLLADGADMFDFVVVNTPDATSHADYAYVCATAGAAIFAIEEMQTRREDFAEAIKRLAISQSPIAGFASFRA